MIARFSILKKLLIGVTLLLLIVCVLSVSGILGVYSYRHTVRMVSLRAEELPLAESLTRSISDLRITFGHWRSPQEVNNNQGHNATVREDFLVDLMNVKDALRLYREQLEMNEPNGSGIGDAQQERETVDKIEQRLAAIEELSVREDWVLGGLETDDLLGELDHLGELADSLPSHLHHRMRDLRSNARGQYHILMGLAWTTSILSVLMLVLFARLFSVWVYQPLRMLIDGSRRVARGDFEHRIELTSHDEMAELATAMNGMTTSFCEIRDDLDQQVKERTKQVVRSEQLASVGFLAAGVAHEINNPLASIAWSAEALESRLHEILYREEADDEEPNPEITVLRDYLRRIQDEAFRCKGITEKLLDFSRIGDVERQDCDLRQLSEDVIEMVKHLGKYKSKRIEFVCSQQVTAHVNAQEIKQVLLNLLTNALDSLEADGVVYVELREQAGQAVLLVRDDGCGMTAEVLEHLFEPFFTRRRDGQGTGLGLSISYRIVIDHGGTIAAVSDGPGTGSQFRVTLPLAENSHDSQYQRRYQAA